MGARRPTAVLAVGLLAVALLGCSGERGGSGSSTTGDRPAVTVTTLPRATLPRYHRSGLRLTTGPDQPAFVYNVYPSKAEPELIRDVVRLWPADLLPYLVIQIIISGTDELPQDERVAALDAMLDASDEAEVPVIVQTLTFSGPKGPGDGAIDAAFEEHPSLVGIGIAELSADYNASISGLQPAQKDAVASRIEQAARHDAVVLWADMGYLGPQVFVDAGADPRLHRLMQQHRRNLIIQVKQNGLGRRFGSMSAAFGLWAAGLADAWGINSEDWLWWEASLQRLGGPQVPGGLTAAGMVRSEYPTRARLTYPEALFGTEMLVVAASGGTVFSIEAPWRGTIDPTGTGEVSPAGAQVVFPVLRRLIGGGMIPSRQEVLDRVRLAYQPTGRDDPALATDLAFSGIYGPDGCDPTDRLTCAQRQWLPSSGRYGIVPTLPVLTTEADAARFPTVVAPPGGTDADRAALVRSADYPAGATGSAWATPGRGRDLWFVADPNENVVTSEATFRLPTFAEGLEVSGTLGAQGFAIVDGRRPTVSILVDNYRTDSARLWSEDIPEQELEELPQDEVGDAEPQRTVLAISVPDGHDRPVAVVSGPSLQGEVERRWNAGSGTLTVSFRHRGPVEVAVG